jgi:hypothetical protein
MQTGEDFANEIGRGFEYTLYNAYLKGSNLFGFMDMKLGRQYVYAGVGKGPLDGLLLKFKAGKKKGEFSLPPMEDSIHPSITISRSTAHSTMISLPAHQSDTTACRGLLPT